MIEQICRPVYTIDKTMLEYTFPLGIDVLEQAIGTQKSLFMKFVLRLRTSDNAVTFRYISTKSSIRRENLIEKCQTPMQLDVNLADLLHFDILQGLLDNNAYTDVNQTSEYTIDTPGSSQTAVIIQQQSLAIPLTFLLSMDKTAFPTNNVHNAYAIDVVSVFTMYFISNVKKNSMIRLLNTGAGFSQLPDGSLVPDSDLLRICPLHRIEGVYGCIARFEIQHGMYEFERTAGFPIATDPDLCNNVAETWAQYQQNPSRKFVRDIATHASNVRRHFRVDEISRKAYVISHDVPWSQAELDNNEAFSRLQYPQHSISIFAIKLDMQTSVSPAPNIQNILLYISMRISVDLAFFSETAMSNRAQICGILSSVTGVHANNIEILPGEYIGATMMQFILVLHIPWIRSSYQNRYVRQLTTHLSNPKTHISMRLQAMFDQRIASWALHTTNSSLEIVQVQADFPNDIHSRRLLSTPDINVSSSTPSHGPPRVSPSSQSNTKNEATKFFVRSYDRIENSDSMLAFWSTAGQFSRMVVFTLRYSLTAYCFMDELQNLKAIDKVLAVAIDSASNSSVASIKVAAFAPTTVIVCPSQNSVDSIITGRTSTIQDVAIIRLDVEVVLYYHNAGTFGMTASKDLQSAGVEKIMVIWTKHNLSQIDIALDTRAFHSDGSLISAGKSLNESTSQTHMSDSSWIGISVGGVVLISIVAFVGYRMYVVTPSYPDASTPLQQYRPLVVVNTSEYNMWSNNQLEILRHNTDPCMVNMQY